MATFQLDQHPDFDAAFSAGVGLSSRILYRTLAANLRRRLASGERVVDVAATVGGASWDDVVGPSAADRRAGSHGRERRRSMRSLVMVTDRRLIEGVHPDQIRELSLGRVNDVRVRAGDRAIATVHVSSDTGDTEIHVVSEWPKRRALLAAESIADAIRRGASSRR